MTRTVAMMVPIKIPMIRPVMAMITVFFRSRTTPFCEQSLPQNGLTVPSLISCFIRFTSLAVPTGRWFEQITEYENIKFDFETLTDLDFIFARANFARSYKGTEPIFNTDGIVDIKQGRHPLLDKHTVVPVDIKLGEIFPAPGDYSQLGQSQDKLKSLTVASQS